MSSFIVGKKTMALAVAGLVDSFIRSHGTLPERVEALFNQRLQDKLSDAAWIMWKNHCGCLLVASAETPPRVAGLITERGICEATESGILSLFPEKQ